MIEEGFAPRLERGERLLWAGRPAQGLLLTGRDGFLIPFSLVWCGFVVFWLATAIKSSAPWFFVLWGVPFLVVGLYMAFGRFVFDAWLRSGLRYAVTNRRILIERPAPFARFSSLRIDRLPQVDLSERANGKGTIRFAPPGVVWGGRDRSAWTPALDPVAQFLAIDDARAVYELIQKTADAIDGRG